MVEKGPTQKMGGLTAPQTCLARWTRLGGFKRSEGNGNVEALVRRVLMGDFGTWPLMVKGPFAPDCVLVSSSYVLVLWSLGGRARLSFWVQPEVKVLSSARDSAV